MYEGNYFDFKEYLVIVTYIITNLCNFIIRINTQIHMTFFVSVLNPLIHSFIHLFIEETQNELISINNSRLNVLTFVEMPSFSQC
jgi:hypothetical protein